MGRVGTHNNAPPSILWTQTEARTKSTLCSAVLEGETDKNLLGEVQLHTSLYYTNDDVEF